MTTPAVIAIVLGYLLGSIPSAYLVGRLGGKIDLTKEGDGHISATAVYRELGRIPFILVLLMDAAKGVLAVYVARTLTDSPSILVVTAYAAVIGHCWSVFLGFKGGLGAVVTYGVLGGIASREFFIAAAVALLLFFTTRKSSLSTYILLATVSAVLLIERKDLVVVLFPLGLMLISLLKRFQVRKISTAYKNELFDDLKRHR